MVLGTTIGIIGGNGFIGDSLYGHLNISSHSFYLSDSKKYYCTSITKENYKDQTKNHFDIIINANGSSSKLLPDKEPLKDFDLNVSNTIKSIYDFSFNLYIYISSCEVYGDLSNNETTKEDTPINPSKISKYGLSKYLAECLVMNHCPKWLILRLNGPIGFGMKKGPIYDAFEGEKLWISKESSLQILNVCYIAKFIDKLIDMEKKNNIFNVVGSDSIPLKRVLMKDKEAPTEPVIIHNINHDKASKIMRMPTCLESLGWS